MLQNNVFSISNFEGRWFGTTYFVAVPYEPFMISASCQNDHLGFHIGPSGK